MPHNVEYLYSLVDRISAPLQKIQGHANKVAENMHKMDTKVASMKMPHSIDELKNKMRDLQAQLETTHSYKSFTNLQKEISKTEHQLVTLQGKSEGMFRKMGGLIRGAMGAMGVYLGAREIISFGKESVKAFDEEAKSIAQLKAGLQSTGGVSQQTLGGLKRQAEDLEKTTLFKHDITMQAQGALLAFSKVRGPIFNQAIVAAQDLATRFKMDLPSAVKMMGKSLQDPVHGMRMLRMAGINFTDDQLKNIKKLIAQGDLYKVQLAVLDGFQKNFGGSAVAAAKAGMGAFQQLQNRVEVLKEVIGERLFSAVSKLSKPLGLVVDSLKRWFEIPASQKIEEERIKVNSLVTELSNHNIEADRRNEIYNELKDLAPEVLDNINQEAINYVTLKNNLKDYNDEMIRKFTIAGSEEAYKNAVQKASGSLSRSIEWEDQLSEAITKFLPKMTAKNAGADAGLVNGIQTDNSLSTAQKAKKLYDLASKNNIPASDLSGAIQDYDISMAHYNADQENSQKVLTKLIRIQNTLAQKTGKIYKDVSAEKNTQGASGSGEKPGMGNPDDIPPAVDGLSAGGSKATQITINLKDLVGEMKITPATMKEGVEQVRDMVTEQMLKVLNSANRIATQ